MAKFNKEKFFENLHKFMSVFLKLGPLIFLEGEQPRAMASGPATPEVVESELVAAFDAAGEIEEGKFGGPILDDGIRRALRSLISLASDNIEPAIDIFNRIVVPRLPSFLDV